MMKLHKCPICAELIEEEQPRFYFPTLPKGHIFCKYGGAVHIDCLRSLPNVDDVSRGLAEIYESFYSKDSATPVVMRERNLVIKDCRSERACFDVYDFDDFAELSVPIHELDVLQRLKPGNYLPLGVLGLQVLHRGVGGKLSLERTKPHFFVDLHELPYETLVSCLLKANNMT